MACPLLPIMRPLRSSRDGLSSAGTTRAAYCSADGARGLMAREAIPGDRRSINVVATEAGEASAAAFYSQLDSELESLLGELTAGERKAFRAGLEKLVLSPAARADEY